MSTADPFRVTDQLEEALLRAMVVRLEARGRHPFFEHALRDYLDAMDIDAAHSVLDAGCGTGIAARTIARRPGFAGRVTAVDLSPYLTSAAARLAAEEGVADRIAFRAGDARHLDLPDRSVDAVVCHTLLSHVEDPSAVVREAARVVRLGGMVGIFDGDYASLTFGHADPERGKAYDEALINAVVSSPRAMRQMPRLLRAAGLTLVTAFPYVLAEIGQADSWLSGIEMYRRLMPAAGVMTEEEARAWGDSLLRDAADGVFFGASNYYGYVATRP
jgi:ubiquinone/menaquinone biosynthesis C-methylase UbiE